MLFPKDLLDNYANCHLDDIYIYIYRNQAEPAIRNCRDYMTIMGQYFEAAYNRIEGLSSRLEMLMIAYAAYLLNSYGQMGNILECGCYKGATSTCLSRVCDWFGKTLYVADSFCGLPEEKGSGYAKGQFAGSLEEVKNNIEKYGKPASVKFIRGYFNESLPGYEFPNLAILWADVDLYSSMRDVLEVCFPQLNPSGLIFSHEITPACIKNGKLIANPPSPVAVAFKEYFDQNHIDYRAKFLAGHSGVFSMPTSLINAQEMDANAPLYYAFPPLPMQITARAQPDDRARRIQTAWAKLTEADFRNIDSAAKTLLEGEIFDENYYCSRYKDVKAYPDGPICHFIRHGRREGRLPGKWAEYWQD